MSESIEKETVLNETDAEETVTDEIIEDETATDEPIEDESAEPTRYTDESGTWDDYGNGIKALVEPSDAWRESNPNEKPEPPPEPPTVWDELAAAYAEGVNSLDQ